jgi:hypothetical protein
MEQNQTLFYLRIFGVIGEKKLFIALLITMS